MTEKIDSPTADTIADYEGYLARFGQAVGDLQVGQYGRFRGRLIPKLDEEAHAERVAAYLELGERFTEMITAGDTIDDSLAVDLRTAEVELVLERSLFVPSFDAPR